MVGRRRGRSQLPTPNSQLPTPNSQLPTPNSQLPTPNSADEHHITKAGLIVRRTQEASIIGRADRNAPIHTHWDQLQRRRFETVLTAGVTREAPVGAEKWSLDSKTASFKSDWEANVPVQWALHPVSAKSNTVTLALLEDGVYSLAHLDWNTGKSVGNVVLGRSPIFNTAGGFFIPLSENDIYVTGVFGPVRIAKPRP